MVSISFIVATTGRDTLTRALRSIQVQMGTEDEVLLVGCGQLMHLVPLYMRVIRVPMNDPGYDWGNKERTVGMRAATRSHIVFVDDDDALVPDAVSTIKGTLAHNPDKPHMFKMIDQNGAVLWRRTEVKQGNHGTPQFVVPNVPGKLGEWTSRYEGDFDFCTSTLALYPPDSLIWVDNIIYACRDFARQYGAK